MITMLLGIVLAIGLFLFGLDVPRLSIQSCPICRVSIVSVSVAGVRVSLSE